MDLVVEQKEPPASGPQYQESRREDNQSSSGFPVFLQTSSFIWRGLSALPKSAKLFMSLLLCVAGFCYLTLLGSIWNDTGLNMEIITEAYAGMGNIELVEHSFKYMFWFFGIFGLTGTLFLMTSFPEKIKTWFAVSVPVLIASDIASPWLIAKRAFFSEVLAASGFFLALSFLILFVLIQYDLWFRRPKGI